MSYIHGALFKDDLFVSNNCLVLFTSKHLSNISQIVAMVRLVQQSTVSGDLAS